MPCSRFKGLRLGQGPPEQDRHEQDDATSWARCHCDLLGSENAADPEGFPAAQQSAELTSQPTAAPLRPRCLWSGPRPPHRSLTSLEQEQLQGQEPLCEGSYQRMGSLRIYVRKLAAVHLQKYKPCLLQWPEVLCHYPADVLGAELLPRKS